MDNALRRQRRTAKHGTEKGDSARRADKAKRQKTDDGGSLADIIGKTVDIPAHVFSVEIPDLMYRGRVVSKDPARKGAVVVRFEEDGSKYWLPAVDVRHWLQQMKATGRTTADATIGAGADEFAASVLTELLTEKRRSSCTAATSSSCSHDDGSVAGGACDDDAQGIEPVRSCGHGPPQLRVHVDCSTGGSQLDNDKDMPLSWGRVRGRRAGMRGSPRLEDTRQQQLSLDSSPQQQSCCSEGACWPSDAGAAAGHGDSAEVPQSSLTSHNPWACA